MEINMLHHEELDDSPNRLIGKFFTNSTPPSLEDTESSLRQQWPQVLPENMTLHRQDNDRFSFNFKQKKDKEHVLANGPWVVNGVMLVIKEFTSNIIDFTVTDLSVTVVGLPLFYQMTPKALSYIEILLSDGAIKPSVTKREDMVINIRTEIDLKKPLKPGFYINENFFVEFKYSNIGDFCYNCGMIDHVKSNCDQIPKERVLNATSKTPVYGPWLRFPTPFPGWMTLKLSDKEKEEDVKECEKTLLYPQFFIHLKFDIKAICNSDSSVMTSSSHSFRFPCSYLESTDLTTSKAYEVITSEINDIIAPYSLEEFEDEDKSVNWPIKEINGEKSNSICSLVEYLNVIKKKNSEDKWLPLELEINIIYNITPVAYQTMLNEDKDRDCCREIEKKILVLVKKKVEEKDNLLCLNTWESDIRKALAEIGYSNYPYLFDVSERAEGARAQAIEMAISLASHHPIPAKRQSVEKLERKKIMGTEIDRLNPCVICYLEMFLAEEVTVLPCSHVFHSLCVNDWFQVGHKCPLCGFKLPSQK